MLPYNLPEASKNIALKGDKRPIVELLPLEVIEHIFETGTRAERADKCWYGIRRLPFPVLVSHVCRCWRSIAIDMPILWTRLDFREPLLFEKSEVWLERTKKAPLDLSIILFQVGDGIDVDDIDDQDDDQDDENQEDRSDMAEHLACILDLIIPHVSRWHSFRLSVNSCKHMYSALERLGKCPAGSGAPILQVLLLSCSEDIDFLAPAEYLEHNVPFGGHAPMLTKAVFCGVSIDWKLLIPPPERSAVSSLYSIPTFTTNLTELEFLNHRRHARPSYEEFITILRCAPNLISLEFSCSGPALRLQGPIAQPIFLPNLRYLQIGFVENEDACALLRMLYAPTLRSISLSFDEERNDVFVRQLAAPMPLPDPQSPSFRDLIFLPSLPEEGEEHRRFVDPREPKSILHNVTEVELFSIACFADSPKHFYSASPHLKRLFLNMDHIPLEFFSVFMEDPAILDCQGGNNSTNNSLSSSADTIDPTGSHPITPLCKHLESLTISGISSDQLISFVKKRKAQGIPLQELTISKELVAVMTEEEESWLVANVRSVVIL